MPECILRYYIAIAFKVHPCQGKEECSALSRRSILLNGHPCFLDEGGHPVQRGQPVINFYPAILNLYPFPPPVQSRLSRLETKGIFGHFVGVQRFLVPALRLPGFCCLALQARLPDGCLHRHLGESLLIGVSCCVTLPGQAENICHMLVEVSAQFWLRASGRSCFQEQ